MSEILGIGIDLIDLDHFSAIYGEDDQALLARCFTNREIADAGEGVDRLARLAVRFSAKEATFKALGGGEGVAHTDIEVIRSTTGEPKLSLNGKAAIVAEQRSIRDFLLSLTHSSASAAAVVVALSAAPS